MSGESSARDLKHEPETAGPGRRGSPMVLLVIAAIVVVCAFARGARMLGPQPGVHTSASAPSPVDTVEPVVDYMETVYAQTPLPEGVQMVQDLAEIQGAPIDRLEVVYFHRTHRCSGCLRAEELTRKTIDTYYADRIQSGEIVLTVDNYEEPTDLEIVRKYAPAWSSLYLGVVKGDQTYIYPVEDIWLVGGDEDQFMTVVRRKIDAVFASQ